MDLTKFDETGNAKDEAVRTRIDNWRREVNFDTWTMYECLNENLYFEKSYVYDTSRIPWEEVWDYGSLYMIDYECDMPINQIDICKFLGKDPEELTKEDIEAYAEAADNGDAYEPFCIDHDKDIEKRAEEFFNKSEKPNKWVHFDDEPVD